MSDPASIKKSLSAQFSVDVPPPLEQIDPEALAKLLRESEDSVTVIDVRLPEEFANGHIAKSVNLPQGELNLEDLVTKVSDLRATNKKHRLVFASLQSPDIDEAAAQEFVTAWEDKGLHKEDPASGFVSLLLGGVFFWLRLNRHDASLTESYCAEQWEAVLSKQE